MQQSYASIDEVSSCQCSRGHGRKFYYPFIISSHGTSILSCTTVHVCLAERPRGANKRRPAGSGGKAYGSYQSSGIAIVCCSGRRECPRQRRQPMWSLGAGHCPSAHDL